MYSANLVDSLFGYLDYIILKLDFLVLSDKFRMYQKTWNWDYRCKLFQTKGRDHEHPCRWKTAVPGWWKSDTKILTELYTNE